VSQGPTGVGGTSSISVRNSLRVVHACCSTDFQVMFENREHTLMWMVVRRGLVDEIVCFLLPNRVVASCI